MDRLTVEEMLSLFHRSSADGMGLSAADAEEYLAIVTYLVGRDARGPTV